MKSPVSTADVVAKVDRMLQQNSSGALFINGPPGAGFSVLLEDLAATEWSAKPLAVLGPFVLERTDVDNLHVLLLDELKHQGYFVNSYAGAHLPNLKATWQWLTDNSSVMTRQIFLVMIEVVDAYRTPVDAVSELFSDIRCFEGVWQSKRVQVIYVIAGSWLHQEIERHFQVIQVSFPYSLDRNYLFWTGVDRSRINKLTNNYLSGCTSTIVGEVVYELSGGNLGAAEAIVKPLTGQPISLVALWESTKNAAASSSMTDILCDAGNYLSERTRKLLKKLLLTRCVAAAQTNNNILGPLVTLGIAKQVSINGAIYVRFFSPYVELCVRENLGAFGITDSILTRIKIEDLIPELDAVCHYSYELIRDIENLVRSHVMLQIHIGQQIDPKQLTGHTSASDWRAKERKNGLLAEFNPLISYHSMSDLATIVAQTTHDYNTDTWRDIKESLLALVPVRDAVMHNRVIDFGSLDRLQQLRAKIYAAISESALVLK